MGFVRRGKKNKLGIVPQRDGAKKRARLKQAQFLINLSGD